MDGIGETRENSEAQAMKLAAEKQRNKNVASAEQRLIKTKDVGAATLDIGKSQQYGPETRIVTINKGNPVREGDMLNSESPFRPGASVEVSISGQGKVAAKGGENTRYYTNTGEWLGFPQEEGADPIILGDEGWISLQKMDSAWDTYRVIPSLTPNPTSSGAPTYNGMEIIRWDFAAQQ